MSAVKSNKALVFAAAAALAAHVFMGLSFIRSAAPTYDETVHLAGGYSILATGRYAMVPTGHPPLAEMAGALPLLVYRPNLFITHPYLAGKMPYHYGDLFLYNNSVPAEKLLNTARAFSLLLWSGLTAFFIWLFASRLFGAAAGAASVAVFSLMPVFISNNALITTDPASAAFYLGAFCMAFMFSSSRGLRKGAGKESLARSCLYPALAGLLSGLAMTSKFSMFILPLLIIAFWIGDNALGPRMRASRFLTCVAAYLAAVLLTAALVYGFDLSAYFSGLGDMFKMMGRGRSSFAWGHHSIQGVWWYFPLALGIKTPLAVMALALAGLTALRRPFKREYLWLILPPLIYFVIAMTAKVQIGFRHVMPVMPFLAVLAGLGAVHIRNKALPLALVSPLVCLWIWGLARTGPYYLAYFNELAGGPAGGYKYLVDSNLDWGQDVKSLAQWLRERGNPPVVLSYFGVARPEHYGMKYVPLAAVSNIELPGTGEDLCRADRLLLAVSATNLQSTYYPDRGTYDWLKSRTPAFTAGHSIFLYDLTSDRAGSVRLAELLDRYGMNAEAECVYSRVEHERRKAEKAQRHKV